MKKIDWAKEAQPYSSGQEHSVAMNDDGTVIEVHRSPSVSSVYRLRFTYGKLEVDNNDKISGNISWSVPETYTHGFYPYVSLNNDGGLSKYIRAFSSDAYLIKLESLTKKRKHFNCHVLNTTMA